MKILIVEDEPEAREGLAALLAEASPDWLILPPCRDGDEGLAAARVQGPDLVITDIRMPERDGLAMIEAYQASGAGAAIVVLSGYPEFEYARRCLSLGVSEYLLKPVTAAVLVETVRRIEDEVFTTRELADLVEGRAAPLGSIPLAPGVLVLVGHAGPLSLEGRRALKREVRSLGGAVGRVWAADGPRETWLFLEHASLARVQAASAGVLGHLSDRAGQPVVACAQAARWDEVPQVAGTLRQAAKRFVVAARQDLVVPSSSTPAPRQEYALTHEGRLSDALRGGPGAVAPVLDRFLDDTFQENFDPDLALRHAQRFLAAALNAVKEVGPSRFRRLLDAGLAERLGSALRWADVQDVFRTCADILGQSEAEDVPDAENQRIRAALAIVQDRLADPPSLGALAEELRLSPEYLSRLFKQEVGEGYARYVMRKRIQYAATLLADRDLPVGTVASKAGFQNTKYFFEVFRRETGQTPGDYRSRFL